MIPRPVTCAAAEEALGALVLGALDPAERDEVEAHLRDCTTCSAVLSDFAPLPGLLHRIDLPTAEGPPPQELVERAIAQATAEAPLAVSQRRWKVVVALGVAAVAAVVLTLSVVVVPRPTSFTVIGASADQLVHATVVGTPDRLGHRVSRSPSRASRPGSTASSWRWGATGCTRWRRRGSRTTRARPRSPATRR